MTTVATRPCQRRRGLFGRCGSVACGACQYCGRLFCAAHGVVLEDGQEICSRRFCTDKRRDLIRHLAYKEVAHTRNTTRLCGVEGCDRPIGGRCGRCDGYFCGRHVDGREEMYLHNGVRMRRMATLCHHCWARRPIWMRQ